MEEIKIYNGTPHPIKIVAAESTHFDANIRKWVSDNPVFLKEIQSNGVLSAVIKSKDSSPILGIPVFDKQIEGCDELPSGYDVYIVSALFASAYRKQNGNTDKLYTVADPVYSEDGRTILGSRGICPAF